MTLALFFETHACTHTTPHTLNLLRITRTYHSPRLGLAGRQKTSTWNNLLTV